jgi:hypothetical protein
MTILLSKNDFWNNLNKSFFEIPLILAADASCLYFLIKDISQDLDEFILTGRIRTNEFHVFSVEREQAIIKSLSQLGLEITYHSQHIECMGCKVMITYLRVRNLVTDTNISLIPWFLLPGRPFPIFLYAYAVWHYHVTGEKSLSLSAAATGKLFGVSSLNKSTVSRTINAMESFIDISRVDEPMSEEREALSDEALVKSISEVLINGASLKSLEENYGYVIKHLPAPIPRKEVVNSILSGIPEEYSSVIKYRTPASGNIRDVRIRPARPRNKNLKRVQRQINFVDSAQIRNIRKGFIEICRRIVLDTAIKYHRFLL